MTSSILVVAAHPDDEVLGCGGTILRHAAEGDNVHVVLMTNGVDAREKNSQASQIRSDIAKKVAQHASLKSLHFNSFPDNKMDSVPLLDVVKSLELTINETRPDKVYTHHYGDLNIDHRITHQAVMTACRPYPGSNLTEIFGFEVLSSTEWQTPGIQCFTPNVFIDISSHIEQKRKLLELYAEEMRQPPHSRSIENCIRLNGLRGSTVGVDYAESFELYRKII